MLKRRTAVGRFSYVSSKQRVPQNHPLRSMHAMTDEALRDLQPALLLQALYSVRKTLQTRASDIAHIGTHNAYHVGQIIFVRKLQGSWNSEKGVK